MSDDEDPPRVSETPGAEKVRTGIELAGLILAPLTSLAGLLYYFGWVRTGAISSYFGFDQALFGYSTNDYIVRSAGLAFRPLAVTLLIGGLALLAHSVSSLILTRWSNRAAHFFILVLAGVGFSLVAINAMLIVWGIGPGATHWNALSLILGALLVEAALSARTTNLAASLPGPASSARLFARRSIVIATVLLGAFWGCAIWANSVGAKAAAAWASSPTLRPGVIIYSTESLELHGPNVTVEELSPNARYAFKYQGFRLLVYSNDRWFLYPEGWLPDGQSAAVILVDSDAIRVELLAAEGAG